MTDAGRGGNCDRRAFLGTLSAALAGAVVSCNSPRTARSGDRRIGRLGVQLYTLRAEMARDVDATLGRVAEIGYEEVEFAGYFGVEPVALRRMLDRHGLRAPSAHVPLERLVEGWDQALADARTLGHRYLVCPWIPERDRTPTGYRRVADLFNRAGEQASRAGIRFSYHNDVHVFAPVDGIVPYDLLLMECRPANVAMQMDVFWFRKAGQDPLRYLASHPTRFPTFHLKDMDAAQEMVDVGRGVIDWRVILARSADAGARHYFVEHDEPDDPFASIRASYSYLRALTF